MRITESQLRRIIREELSDGGLSAIRAWHGSSRPLSHFRAPAFFADDPKAARWFATERSSSGSGVLMEVDLDIRRPAGTADLISAARKAGVEITEDPYFEAPEISEHSPYEGSNPLDLVYIPRVRDELRRQGCDGVRAWDLLESSEVLVWVTLDDNQARTVRVKPH